MLDACLTPAVAAELTLQPVRRHGVDAAIFFSDIVVPLRLAGVGVEIVPGVGPVIAEPVRTARDVDRLAVLAQDALAPVTAGVSEAVDQLGSIPLIGFGGAPFTLASYLIEGGPSRDLPHCRAMMRDDPDQWDRLLSWCADVTVGFLRAQVLAGASAIQIFDSWAGRLGPGEYERFAAPHSARLFSRLTDLVDADGSDVPRVHFGVGTAPHLEPMLEVGATVLGIDTDTDLAKASERLHHGVPLQGNISPDVLAWPWEAIAAHVDDVIARGARAPGHIINLGHGVPPETDPDVLTRIVDHVHRVTV